MAKPKAKVIVVGAGVFGVTAALELARRNYQVSLFDPGPLPHPNASSTDISKVVRMDYGADELYMQMMEEAFEGWYAWNKAWPRPLYHETGFVIMSREEMSPGGFEYESMQLLQKHDHEYQRLGGPKLKARFPAWNAAHYPDGYYNPRAGWAESGAVVAQLIKDAAKAGVALFEGHSFERLLENGSRVAGIRATDGADHPANNVVFAAGPWTPILLSHLEAVMTPVGQPVLHFRPENHRDYQPPKFVVWAADISNTGWYGFPAKEDGTLKIANHGPGWQRDPRGDRAIPKEEEDRFRTFLSETFPDIANAPKIGERMCFYCDAWDGNFYITPDPGREGLILSTGGSGHGFKFAPILGQITADVLEGKGNKYAPRFAWRTPGEEDLKEHSRHKESA